MNKYYILKDKTPVPVGSVQEWVTQFNNEDKAVKQEDVGDVWVSTVFLGIDHNWGEGPPILFETMIFGGENDQYQERYSTWEEAEEGHNRIVKDEVIRQECDENTRTNNTLHDSL